MVCLMNMPCAVLNDRWLVVFLLLRVINTQGAQCFYWVFCFLRYASPHGGAFFVVTVENSV